MKKHILYILGVALVLSGCNFLDKEPDLRAHINTQKKVRLLLTSAYEMPNYGPLGEVSSDNTVDNNTDPVNKKVPMSQMYDEYFAWEEVKSDSQQDSPYYIWQGCYNNIAVANQALAAIEKLEAEGVNMQAERAEALMIRAYNHFILVNVFCQAYRNDTESANDLGVHYMTEAETTVKPQYDRSNVAEVYRLIEADLEAALPYVSDDYYSVPKYHFNQKAAYAFAARFYLFKRDYNKVIACANRVLGTTPDEALAMMWNAALAHEQGNPEEEASLWINPSDNANLMLATSMSVQVYAWIPDYARYTFNRAPMNYTINTSNYGGGPCWSGNFPVNAWRYDSNFGSFLCKIKVFFEYTDKVAGIGYGHTMRRELTAGETLLCRAEANIMLGNKAAALSDMAIWAKGYACDKELTDARIKSYFTGRNVNTCPELHCADMDAQWGAQYAKADKEYLWCCLHLRRIETLHDGTRWFDVKRLGIEVDHEIGYPAVTKHLVWNDDRRAIQLPQEAILAGQKPNPRAVLGDNNSVSIQTATSKPTMTEMYLKSMQTPIKLVDSKK